MSDTLTPEQIATLKGALEMSRSENVATAITGNQTLEHFACLYAPALLATVEECAALRAERAKLRRLLDLACEDESEIHRRLDAVLPPDTMLTVKPLMGGRTPLCGDDGRAAQLVAENARLRDMLARVQVEDRWRPIDTAPKDGTRVMLWHALWTNAEAAYAVNSPNVGIIWKLVGCDYLVGIPPTHWRPLPLTPAEEAELDALRKVVAMEGETP